MAVGSGVEDGIGGGEVVEKGVDGEQADRMGRRVRSMAARRRIDEFIGGYPFLQKRKSDWQQVSLPPNH